MSDRRRNCQIQQQTPAEPPEIRASLFFALAVKASPVSMDTYRRFGRGLVVAEDSTGGHQPSQYLHVDAGKQFHLPHVVVDSGISPTPFVSFTGRDQLRSSRTTKPYWGFGV
nr:hypothetical protein Iba_chr10eCG1520 [Ipomoea batatas]